MRDILVEYKGGGYDGCFWQWNFFYFDSDGDFHNILSTGYKGIKSEEQAREFLADYDPNTGWTTQIYNRFKPTVYHLDDIEELLSFTDGGNASLMLLVAEWFAEHTDIILMADCYNCERGYPVTEMNPDHWSGDGGIVYSAKDLFCEDCYYITEDNMSIVN